MKKSSSPGRVRPRTFQGKKSAKNRDKSTDEKVCHECSTTAAVTTTSNATAAARDCYAPARVEGPKSCARPGSGVWRRRRRRRLQPRSVVRSAATPAGGAAGARGPRRQCRSRPDRTRSTRQPPCLLSTLGCGYRLPAAVTKALAVSSWRAGLVPCRCRWKGQQADFHIRRLV